MDPDLKATRISVLTHAIVAMIIGWVSLQLATFYYAFPLAIAVLIALGFIMERALGKRGIKWWIGTGVIIYLFVWYVTWTYLFNLLVA